MEGGENFGVGDSEGCAVRVAQDFEHYRLAIGFGDAQAGGEGGGVGPHFAGAGALVECFGYGGATGGLHGDHARTFYWLDPAEFFEFGESFPHADEAYAAAGGIKNRVGIFPAELFDQFVAHGLFSFHAERFFERGNVEPAFGLAALGDDAAAVGDEAVNQRDVCAIGDSFDVVREGNIARHENVGGDAGGSGVGS